MNKAEKRIQDFKEGILQKEVGCPAARLLLLENSNALRSVVVPSGEKRFDVVHSALTTLFAEPDVKMLALFPEEEPSAGDVDAEIHELIMHTSFASQHLYTGALAAAEGVEEVMTSEAGTSILGELKRYQMSPEDLHTLWQQYSETLLSHLSHCVRYTADLIMPAIDLDLSREQPIAIDPLVLFSMGPQYPAHPEHARNASSVALVINLTSDIHALTEKVAKLTREWAETVKTPYAKGIHIGHPPLSYSEVRTMDLGYVAFRERLTEQEGVHPLTMTPSDELNYLVRKLRISNEILVQIHQNNIPLEVAILTLRALDEAGAEGEQANTAVREALNEIEEDSD